MAEKCVQVIVTGAVQGVGFRAHCQRQAVALGVTGWVRNRWDGSVEALCAGPAEAVDALVAWCHSGPPAAEVTGVAVTDAPASPAYRSFSIKFF